MLEGITAGPVEAGRRHTRFERFGPLAVVAAVVAYLLVELWPETAVVAYTNDSAMHSEMVRFASARFASGHVPLNGWFPFLNLGSPDFLHYQSLPAMITGVLGLAVGPGHAFSWSLYVLLATWPVSVFLGARLLGLPPWASAAAATMSPFVVSAPGLGYEQSSYLWIGYGLWTQLWGMWLLPLAWGLSSRAIREGRAYFAAVITVSLTMAVHFMTGYLAVIPLVLFVFLRPSELRRRLVRGAVVLGGSLLGTVWVIGPLLQMKGYAAINEFLQHTSHADSFGARRVLSWLAEGSLFDFGRFPVITICLGIGLLACMVRFRREESRALLVLFAMSLVLFFGRPTFGSLTRLLPGSEDLFLRRFVMGVQLAGLFIAGSGTAALAETVQRVTRDRPAVLRRLLSRRRALEARRALVGLLGLGFLAPAVAQLHGYDAANARYVHTQARADATLGRDVDALVTRLSSMPPGRVYAGLPVYSWGDKFFVGGVPVLQFLTTRDVDEVGFTLRTASLMSDPEPYFDEYLPGDYRLFAVRYLVLPAGRRPPVKADRVMGSGPYVLWSVPGVGYVQVVDSKGVVHENRADIGKRSASFVRSSLPGRGIYPTVAYGGRPAAPPTLSGRRPPGPAGTVTSQVVHLSSGQVTARIVAHRAAVVVLSASYDPGWVATVDGRPAPIEMIAPALVGVRVARGAHVVRFRFEGIGDYPMFFALSGAALAAVGAADLLRRRRRGHPAGAAP